MQNRVKIATLSLALATFMAACNSSAPAPTPAAPEASAVTNGIDLDNLKSATAGSDAFKVALALEAQKGALSKLSFPLVYAYVNRDTALSSQAIGKGVVVDAIASGDAAELLSQLQALGLTNSAAYGNVVSGRLQISMLGQVAALSGLKSMRLSLARTNAGLVQSQGDKAQRSDIARSNYGLTGAGVKVGVLSDSMNNFDAATLGTPKTTYAQDIVNNDLPAGGVTILQEGGSAAADEGRAMAQIIHDVAPGAQLYFSSAFNGEASFAQGIVNLQAAGAKVIVDDVFYYDEPAFQDGLVASAVDTVKAAGAAYFSSAGNQATDSWEGTFKPGLRRLNGEVTNDFSGGANDNAMGITIPAGGSLLVTMQWDEPFSSKGPDVPGGVQTTSPGASSDYNLYLTNESGSYVLPIVSNFRKDGAEWQFPFLFQFDTQPFTLSTDNNIGADPFEAVFYQNQGTTPLRIAVAVTRKSGTVNRRMKLNFYDSFTAPEYPLDKSTIFGHSNAAGAFSTGAVRYSSTPAFGATGANFKPEYFTSAGGTPILLSPTGTRLNTPVLRQKPEATAPDGADTSFFYPLDNDRDATGFPNFYGTSAAAPHAAAVAALLKQANPALSPDTVYSTLKTTALDMLTPGYDVLTGAGLIQADAAVASVASASAALAQTIDFEEFTTPGNDPPSGNFRFFTSYSKSGYDFTSSTNILYGLKGYGLPSQGFLGGQTNSGSVLRIAKPASAAFNLFSFDYTVVKNTASYPGTAIVKGFFKDGTTLTRTISYAEPVQPFQTLNLNWFDLVKVEINPGLAKTLPIIDNVKVQDR